MEETDKLSGQVGHCNFYFVAYLVFLVKRFLIRFHSQIKLQTWGTGYISLKNPRSSPDNCRIPVWCSCQKLLEVLNRNWIEGWHYERIIQSLYSSIPLHDKETFEPRREKRETLLVKRIFFVLFFSSLLVCSWYLLLKPLQEFLAFFTATGYVCFVFCRICT